MAQYYFTVASLPMLVFEEEPILSSDELLVVCASELSGGDMFTLKQAREYFSHGDESPTPEGILGAFDRWERGVREILARLRAQRLGWEYEPADTDVSIDSEKTARDSMSQSSPIDAEMVLQQARWRVLEELSVGHYFDIDSIVVYMLKTLVLERNMQMEPEEGAERFNEIYSNMVQELARPAQPE